MTFGSIPFRPISLPIQALGRCFSRGGDCQGNPFMTTPLSDVSALLRFPALQLRHSAFPTFRFPALHPAEPSQTSSCLLAPISLYNLCTLMDSFGLYSLLASYSLHVIR